MMVGKREFCEQDGDGNVDDADMHDPVLDNSAAERSVMTATRARMLEQGMTQAEVDEFFPLD